MDSRLGKDRTSSWKKHPDVIRNFVAISPYFVDRVYGCTTREEIICVVIEYRIP